MMHERRFNREIERLRDPDRVARLEVKRVVDIVMKYFGEIQSVLDVGTGSGLFAEEFAARHLQVAGVDANPVMVETASRFVPSGEFREGIAEKLPFLDGSSDVVFMGLLLHETDDSLAAVKEAHRVCRKGLSILEWPYEAQPFGPPLVHRMTPDTISMLAEQSGFTSVKQVHLQNLSLYLLEKQ